MAYRDLLTPNNINGMIYLNELSVDGFIDMNNMNITNLRDPVELSDAATKNYVDNGGGSVSVPLTLLGNVNNQLMIQKTGHAEMFTVGCDGVNGTLASTSGTTEILNTTVANDVSTGSLITHGGVGIDGSIWAQKINSNDTLVAAGSITSERGEYAGFYATGNKYYLVYQIVPSINESIYLNIRSKIDAAATMYNFNFFASSDEITSTIQYNHEIVSKVDGFMPASAIPRINVYDSSIVTEHPTVTQITAPLLQYIATGYSFGNFRPLNNEQLSAISTPIGAGSNSENFWLVLCKNHLYDPLNIIATSNSVAYAGGSTEWLKFSFTPFVDMDPSSTYSFCIQNSSHMIYAPINPILPVPNYQNWGIWNTAANVLEAWYSNIQCAFTLFQNTVSPRADIVLYTGTSGGTYADVTATNQVGSLIWTRISAPSIPLIYSTYSSAPNISSSIGNITINKATITGTTNSVSLDTGSLICDGGCAITYDLTLGGGMNIIESAESGGVDSGALVMAGGLGVGKSIFCGGNINVISSTESTSYTSGSMVVSGGVGVTKNLYVGGTIYGTINQSFGDVYKHGNLTSASIIAGYDASHIVSYDGQYAIDNSDTNASKLLIRSPNGAKLMQVACDQLWNTGQIYSTASNMELWGNSSKSATLNNVSVTIEPTTESSGFASGSLIAKGGLGVYKNIFMGSSIFYSMDNVTISTGAGPFNNVEIPNHNFIIIINNSDDGSEITGFHVTTQGNTNGHNVSFYCDSGTSFSIANLNSGSTSSNQIKTCTGASVTMTPPCYFSLAYITTLTKWILTNTQT
jgi:hypothetical protein